MKKIFTTMAIAAMTLVASAQEVGLSDWENVATKG